MTALTEDKQIELTDGVLLDFPVDDADTIYGGSLVCVNADGYLVPGADTAGLIFQGVSTEQKDNSSGSDGDLDCVVRRRGLVKVIMDTAISQANVGDNVFLVDDQTVDLAANVDNNIFCGIIAKYIDSTHAWIDIEPAIRQADVATHIADADGAHAASAISSADAGGFTANANVEDILQEILQHIVSAQKIIQIPLTALTLEDGTAITTFSDGDSATPGFNQVSNKELVLRWNNHATPTKVGIGGIALPPDLDPASDVVIHWRAKMSGANDSPVLEHECYLGAGDTDCAGTDDEIDGGASLTEYTATIAAADVTGAPEELTLIFGPKAGELGTDDLLVYSVWIEYTGKALTA